MRGCPHCHIVGFLHPDDKMNNNIDAIDQCIWAEIPLDYNSGDSESYLKAYRAVDKNRPHRWNPVDAEKLRQINKVQLLNIFQMFIIL